MTNVRMEFVCLFVCFLTYVFYLIVHVLIGYLYLFKLLSFFYFFKFYFIFKLNITVLDLPNIKMNPPQVYMCSPSWTLLPGVCFLLIRENSWFTALSLENDYHWNVPLLLTYCDHEFLHKVHINIFFKEEWDVTFEWLKNTVSYFLDVSQWLRFLTYRILGKFLQQKMYLHIPWLTSRMIFKDFCLVILLFSHSVMSNSLWSYVL